MIRNLIFLTEQDLDRPVYRVFTYDRIEQVFRERALGLLRPRKWEDPFENFILGAEGTLQDGTPYNIGFREDYFGQCWSLTKESDAMWRIYSPQKDGVKVKTTIRKLFQPVFEAGGISKTIEGDDWNMSSFIGKVKYQSSKSLVAMLKNDVRMNSKVLDQSGWGQASTFYFKRYAFKHENEVRIIYRNPNNAGDVVNIPVDPNLLFDEIVLDPRMGDQEVLDLKTKLLDWGYAKKVTQSGLYKLPQLRIRLQI